jgi:hypothetical protein
LGGNLPANNLSSAEQLIGALHGQLSAVLTLDELAEEKCKDAAMSDSERQLVQGAWCQQGVTVAKNPDGSHRVAILDLAQQVEAKLEAASPCSSNSRAIVTKGIDAARSFETALVASLVHQAGL